MRRERCCVGAQVTDLCRNVCDSYGDAQPSTAAGGDRGDNTARCGAVIWSQPARDWVTCGSPIAGRTCSRYGYLHVPAADRQTDEERRLAWFTDDELAAELARRAAAADNSDGGSDA